MPSLSEHRGRFFDMKRLRGDQSNSGYEVRSLGHHVAAFRIKFTQKGLSQNFKNRRWTETS